jgi:hypothetical protein
VKERRNGGFFRYMARVTYKRAMFITKLNFYTQAEYLIATGHYKTCAAYKLE